jgi:hypothetical protein
MRLDLPLDPRHGAAKSRWQQGALKEARAFSTSTGQQLRGFYGDAPEEDMILRRSVLRKASTLHFILLCA